MLFADYAGLDESQFEFGVDPSLKVGAFGDVCSVNGWVAIRVSYTSPRYKRGDIHEIRFADRPKDRGLCFLLTTAGEGYIYSAASAIFVAAFLTDVGVGDQGEVNAGTYRYKNDYVVIYHGLHGRYVADFRDSSHVWGGFYHAASPAHSASNWSDVIAYPGLALPTAFHESEAFRANSDASALGRFLALYHLLELSFDYDLVEEIKALPHDLKRVGKLLASFDHGELARLQRLVGKYWKDEDSLSKALGRVFANGPDSQRLQELLFEYEKDGFPWRHKNDQVKFSDFLSVAATSFSKSSFSAKKLEWTVEALQKAVAFVVYRFRCAIAHASIGECVLSAADDAFVHQVGEPLLTDLLAKVFRR